MNPCVRIPGAALVAACALLGCARELPPAAPPMSRERPPAAPPMSRERPPAAPPMSGEPPDLRSRDAILGPFLAEYWKLPVPPQGEAPEGFSAAEASLDPLLCRACHPSQYAEWRESLHAGAYSPGFAGQLVEGSLAAPRKLRHCQTCHAPLAEQQPVSASGQAEPHFDVGLREQGIVCASCHLRAHRRFGPPRRPELPPPAEVLPHGGFEARPEFGEARFCSTCHQFYDEGVAGKPVQNTFVEWRESRHAAEGRSCQSCHMPDRAHSWRGIHDPEMVRDAVDVELVGGDLAGDPIEASLVLANHGVGHAFPTYVTPRVFLAVWQADAAHEEIEGTRAEAIVGREIDFSSKPPQERFDTRVLPDASATLGYAVPRHSRATSLVGRVSVDPGHHYRAVYEGLLRTLEDPGALEQIREALRREEHTPYLLVERRLELPPG